MTASTTVGGTGAVGAGSAEAEADGSTTRGAGGSRRWSHPRQRLLLLVSAGVILGAFMPWIETGLGTYRGFAGPGPYLFYAGVLGLGAGLVPVRALAVVQGAVVAVAAVGLPVWQVVRLATRVGFEGWAPGLGLLLVLGCGVMATKVTIDLARPPRS